VDVNLLTIEDTVHKNVVSSKDINIYVETKMEENGLSTTKFGLESVPFKLSKMHSVVSSQNIANKYNHENADAPSHGISSVIPNYNNTKLAILSET